MDTATMPPTNVMNGATSLLRTLIASDVRVCFANPGTSEMHFVEALDRVEGMRCVPCLFEGVVSGAADAYYRIAEKPAATLLHLGPGLGNALANLHNAKKARSGIVNVVGEHALEHIRYDAPLTADIEGIARPVSNWVRTSRDARALAADTAAAVEAAREYPGQVATLVLPANVAWETAEGAAFARRPSPPARVSQEAIAAGAAALKSGAATVLLLGGGAVRGRALELAGRIAAKTGCRIMAEFALARAEGGAGRVAFAKIPYVVDAATAALAGARQMVLVGSRPPVSFFAYPDKPSLQAPADCLMVPVARVDQDVSQAMEALADALGATATPPAGVNARSKDKPPTGPITPEGIAAVVAALLPENAIVIDESVSTGRGFARAMTGAAPHDWMNIMGGSIGWGLPAAVGAAVAARDRKVVVMESDGSAMYTVSALWSLARESLDATILLFSNRSYRILQGELQRMGGGRKGSASMNLLELDQPPLDWQSIAKGHGLPFARAETLEELARAFERGLKSGGPNLVEVVLP